MLNNSFSARKLLKTYYLWFCINRRTKLLLYFIDFLSSKTRSFMTTKWNFWERLWTMSMTDVLNYKQLFVTQFKSVSSSLCKLVHIVLWFLSKFEIGTRLCQGEVGIGSIYCHWRNCGHSLNLRKVNC